MLKMSARAEVLALSPRIEYHGDDRVKAVTVKLKFTAVPLDVIEAGFIGQLSLFYGATLEPDQPEIACLELSREVEHARVVIDGVELANMRIDNVRVELLAQRVCELQLKVKGVLDYDVLDDLHDTLGQTVPVMLEEHAPPVEADEMEEAA